MTCARIKASNALVAIQAMKVSSKEAWMDRLSQELIGFDSRYVVKYYDVIERKNELWVEFAWTV